MEFTPLRPRIHVAPTPALKMNSVLITGDERALLIDTGSGPDSAQRLHEAAREVTDLPLTVVNTHAHFDHLYGNARFASSGVEDFWGHPDLAAHARREEAESRASAVVVDPSAAQGHPDSQLHLPNRVLQRDEKGAVLPQELDLGGITATLFFLGRGHTDHDLLIGAEDVLIVGDLVEVGEDPHFEGSYPKEWIRTLGKITALDAIYTEVVPGHGAVTDMEYVNTQRLRMRQAVTIIEQAMLQTSSDMTKAVPILPYSPRHARILLTRLMELAAEPSEAAASAAR